MDKMTDRFERVDKLISNGVYLYGAGTYGEWVYDYCRRCDINVIAFIDSDTQKHGKNICNTKCISYDEYLKNDKDKAVLLTTKHFFKQLYEKYHENSSIMPFDTYFYLKNEKEYSKLIFEDDKSYSTLEGIIKYMTTGIKKHIWEISEHDQYFGIAPFWGTYFETYVDIGAFTGDSIERFLASQGGGACKIYAFEPVTSTFNILKKRIKRLAEEWTLDPETFICENKLVGNCSGFVNFNESGHQDAHISDSGESRTEQITLDDYFKNINVTFIKADIEGAEFEMLCGGKNTIERCKPKLTICVYHKPDDLLRIYNLINNWNLGYKFKLRQHYNICMETVLYCYTEE